MLNNEEPINLMFRTSPQLLTTSSYDSIRRQNYGEIILLQRAPHLCTSGSYTQPPNMHCVITPRIRQYARDQSGEFIVRYVKHVGPTAQNNFTHAPI